MTYVCGHSVCGGGGDLCLSRVVSTECASLFPKSDDRERTQKGSPSTIHRFAREVIWIADHPSACNDQAPPVEHTCPHPSRCAFSSFSNEDSLE